MTIKISTLRPVCGVFSVIKILWISRTFIDIGDFEIRVYFTESLSDTFFHFQINCNGYNSFIVLETETWVAITRTGTG